MEKKELKKYLKNDSIIFIKCTDVQNFKQNESPDYFTIRGGFDPYIYIIENITFTDEDGTVYKDCIQVINNRKIDFINKAFQYAEFKKVDKFYYVSKKNKTIFTMETKMHMFTKKSSYKFDDVVLKMQDNSNFNYSKAEIVGHISFVCLGPALSCNKEFNEKMLDHKKDYKYLLKL